LTQEELKKFFDELKTLSSETEWVEFKEAKSSYIKYRAFDDEHYKKMVIAFIKKYGSASRKEIDDLLMGKLSDALEEKQKRNKIHNLLYEMYKKDETIRNTGSKRKPKWVLI
jgi:ATP-dependent DNA helicase RecG